MISSCMIRTLNINVYSLMNKFALNAISPIDGRYAEKVNDLREIFSEYGLIRYRVLVEVRWLQCLHSKATLPELSVVAPVLLSQLNQIIDDFAIEDAINVKEIETTTNHDVKAIEYFISNKLGNKPETEVLRNFLHFACTSEDINNLSYALMMKKTRSDILNPVMESLRDELKDLALKNADLAMLSRTHGQIASPSTLGKEIANTLARIDRTQKQFLAVKILGKFNGAVGNYNAHLASYPDVDWQSITQEFIESLKLEPNSHTTQIEPHDWVAEYCHALMRYNTILIDFSRDIWSYISLGYFKQKVLKDEVGSSTMPHKVNPIDFENAEGNLGIANAMLAHFSEKLPISRWQRDLTDSTVQRNLGTAMAHMLIAFKSLLKGIKKLEVNSLVIKNEFEDSYEVLAEAIQTVMRRYGVSEPYEKLKGLTRGQAVNKETLTNFIRTLDIPETEIKRLLDLTPDTYTGLAEKLANDIK